MTAGLIRLDGTTAVVFHSDTSQTPTPQRSSTLISVITLIPRVLLFTTRTQGSPSIHNERQNNKQCKSPSWTIPS